MVHQHNFEMAWTSVFWIEGLNCNDNDDDYDDNHHHHYSYCYYMQSGLVSREVLLVLEQ
jgi:hypothetical protein